MLEELHMRRFGWLTLLAGLVLAIVPLRVVQAQSPVDQLRSAPVAPVAPAPAVPEAEPYKPNGPTIYLCDISGVLWAVDIATKKAHRIGSSGAPLTDITFTPDGRLFGLSFTDFYEIDQTTGEAIRIGSTGRTDLNALT